MQRGQIKKLVTDRGFGFIQPEEGADVFFHHASVEGGVFDDLQVGQSVEFETSSGGDSGKGPRAERVRLVE